MSQSNSDTTGAAAAQSELMRELDDAKDKLKIMTTKFATARKERD